MLITLLQVIALIACVVYLVRIKPSLAEFGVALFASACAFAFGWFIC